MRILWNSNAAWSSTGYGVQTRLFAPRIRDLGHDVSMLAFYGLEGGTLNFDGMNVYPRAIHPYGQDAVRGTAEHVNADIVVSLMDAWVCEPRRYPDVRHVLWFPVDMEPLPDAVKHVAEKAFTRIVMSRFGERMVNDAGLDCIYIPHGVETDVYRPMDKQAARLKIDPTGQLADRFVVGMVAANKGNAPSRKAWPQQIKAFAEFQKAVPEAFLYLHTTAGPQFGGVNLYEYVEHCGLTIGRDVVFCDQFHNHLGFPDEYMVDTYNAFDVLLSVSMGEGFGVPILEAQACGVPVIVGDWTAMSELCFSGWKVPKYDAMEYPIATMGHTSVQWLPHVDAIRQELQNAWQRLQRDDVDSVRRRAREGALTYDADLITETYWKPALKQIAQQVDGHKAMLLRQSQPVPSGLEAAE